MVIIRQAIVMVLLFAGAFGCIGNPNGVSISFPDEITNMSNAYNYCRSTPSCISKKDSILYATGEGLAVTLYDGKMNIEIPINEQGEPAFNFTNWTDAIRREMQVLANYKVLNLTEQDIDKIVNSGYLQAGAMMLYSKEGDIYVTNSIAYADNGQISKGASQEKQTYCSGPVVSMNDLQKSPNRDQNPLQGILTPLGQKSEGAAPSSTETHTRTTPRNNILNYWWVSLLVLAVVFLVFKMQFSGKDEKMTPEDMAVLSAPRRVELMKLLTERNKTLTELSKETDISLPTAKEHLEKLAKSGLVEKMDSGHKWKYYKLTKRGERILDSTKFDT